MSAHRVIVCGGRDYRDRSRMIDVLAALPADMVIVTGGARGADTIAHEVAIGLGMATEVHRADWRTHGRAAGPIRNQTMLDAGANLVIAFPGGRGTADMVARAERADVPVWIVGLCEAMQAARP